MKRRDFLRTTAVGGTAALVLRSVPGCTPRPAGPASLALPLDEGWRFHLGDAEGASSAAFDDAAWAPATLPHAARVEALVTGAPGSDTWQWQGTCWYRRTFALDAEAAGKRVFLHFDAAMSVADVWWNGEHLGRHMGGWLPFAFDVTDHARPGGDNVVAVRLDNTDNALTGPKPLAQLDFNPYHGLYRHARLVLKDPLHVTDPLLVDAPASGGLFVTFPRVSREEAVVRVQTHVRNDGAAERRFRARVVLTGPGGEEVASDVAEPVTLGAGGEATLVQELTVARPRLWDLRDPNLHEVAVELVDGVGAVADRGTARVGIRHFEISAEGFSLNGERRFLRGTNRHQEYPYVGYALSDAAQWRDAKKIKDAGFDYVRLSHYPHAPAFMDACDELGLVVMDCIPGWQYFDRESEAFAALQLDNCRKMIRRDRNHPCVILWEVSLNESWMTEAFIAASHAAAHEELPVGPCYTCGWTEGYDVFIQARQHGGCVDVAGRACVVSEYGDWEYYAQNAGLNQGAWADLAPDEANSRQLRGHGERAMLQQATNFQEAHNDNRKTLAFGDGLWVMFDYNRGYAPDVESSGCVDLFRVPKLSRAFFRSQRDAGEVLPVAESGPMVFIASWWDERSSTDVRVFSNCDEVELFLNGVSLGRRSPDAGRTSTHLAHPPFTFPVGRFEAGTLEAVAWLEGREAARHAVRTPGRVAALALEHDLEGRGFAQGAKDVTFVRARLVDAEGTTVHAAWENVFFGATGSLELVGANPFSSEAGVASILLQGEEGAAGAVYALAVVEVEGRAQVLSAGLGVGAAPAAGEIRVTTDGSEPTASSSVYAGSLETAARVRAALFAAGAPVVLADGAAPRFRIPGSTAPRREG
ncbi:MAG: beta-galactosidase [Gemmatimonadota bacterium]